MSRRGAPGPETEPGSEPASQPGAEPARALSAQDDEGYIRAVLEKLPSDTRTKVKRSGDNTKRWELHGFLAPEEATMEFISRRFGGGRYLVEVMRRNDKGSEVVVASRTWDIPGIYRGVGKGLPGIHEDAAPVAGPPGPGGRPAGGEPNTRELIDSALASRVLDLLNRDNSKGGATNWEGIAAMVTAFGTLATPFIERMLDKRDAGDPLVRELLTEMRSARETHARAPGPTSSALADATRGIRQVLELQKTLMPGGEEKADTITRLLDILPAAIAAFRGQPIPMQPGETAGQIPPGGAPVTDTPATAGITNADGTANWDIILGGFRDQLLGMANQGWEPEWCAELVQRALPGEYAGLMTEFLQKPPDEARALVEQAIPELRAYTKWLPDFLAELRDLMLGDGSPDEDEK